MPDNQETPEERARRLGVPFVKPIRMVPYQSPNPVVAVCGGCGRDVHRVEGYSCPRGDCPIQPRVTSMCMDMSTLRANVGTPMEFPIQGTLVDMMKTYDAALDPLSSSYHGRG